MLLRDVVEEDLPAFFEHQREAEANRMAALPARDHAAFMAHWHTRVLGDRTAAKQTIVVDGEVAGNILSWDQGERRLVGYWLGSAYWGRGLATAALAAFLAGHEPIRPLYAYVAVANVGSRRVLEKCGFRRCGEALVGPDGVAEYLMQLGTTVRPGRGET